MAIRAIAFDVDGTLYPNSSMYLHSLRFGLKHMRLLSAYAKVRRKIRQVRPISDLLALEGQMLATELGITEDEAQERLATIIHGEWERILDRVRLFPHVRDTLERLRDAGCVLAAASDFPIEQKLKRLRLSDLFDCQLWTADSGYLKPHPEPFVELSECIKVEAANILYVGNSYSYDVVGAKNVGMLAGHVSRRAVRNTVADLTFWDYRDLAEWVFLRQDP